MLLLALLGAGTEVSARPKTDVVKLKNGDRLTGESKKLDRGILTFKTDALDTVSIEWENVVEIVSEFDFESRALDGSLYFGSLGAPSKPGHLVIRTTDGDVELPILEVTELLPIETKFWEKFDGEVSLGFDSSSASDVTQFSGGAEATFRTAKWESTGNLSVIVNRQDPESTSRENLSFTRLRKWSRRRFSGALVSAEANEELGLDLRLLAGGVAGRDVVESPYSRLRLAGGLAVNREEREEQDPDENIEAVLVLSCDLFRFVKPETDLKIDAIFYPNLTEGSRLRAEATIALEYEITKDLDWVLSAYDTYESDPATADVEKHDWGVSLSLAWDF